jgi:hypothetical protein
MVVVMGRASKAATNDLKLVLEGWYKTDDGTMFSN